MRNALSYGGINFLYCGYRNKSQCKLHRINASSIDEILVFLINIHATKKEKVAYRY